MIILKSVTMMLGELDYDRTFLENYQEQHFHNLNLIILLIFAIIMPILLMNLLVGLAIGDLMQIQQNARLKRLATQVCFSLSHIVSDFSSSSSIRFNCIPISKRNYRVLSFNVGRKMNALFTLTKVSVIVLRHYSNR